MSASQRRKGHAFERWVANSLREALPTLDIRRGLQSQGEVVPDIIAPAIWLECKRGKLPNPRAALRQAQEAAAQVDADRIPVAVIKDDRQEAFVVLTWDDFRLLYSCLLFTKHAVSQGETNAEPATE